MEFIMGYLKEAKDHRLECSGCGGQLACFLKNIKETMLDLWC